MKEGSRDSLIILIIILFVAYGNYVKFTSCHIHIGLVQLGKGRSVIHALLGQIIMFLARFIEHKESLNDLKKFASFTVPCSLDEDYWPNLEVWRFLSGRRYGSSPRAASLCCQQSCATRIGQVHSS